MKTLTSTIWDQPVNIWSWAACSSRFLLYFHPHRNNCWIVSLTSLSSTSLPKELSWGLMALHFCKNKLISITRRDTQKVWRREGILSHKTFRKHKSITWKLQTKEGNLPKLIAECSKINQTITPLRKVINTSFSRSCWIPEYILSLQNTYYQLQPRENKIRNSIKFLHHTRNPYFILETAWEYFILVSGDLNWTTSSISST